MTSERRAVAEETVVAWLEAETGKKGGKEMWGGDCRVSSSSWKGEKCGSLLKGKGERKRRRRKGPKIGRGRGRRGEDTKNAASHGRLRFHGYFLYLAFSFFFHVQTLRSSLFSWYSVLLERSVPLALSTCRYIFHILSFGNRRIQAEIVGLQKPLLLAQTIHEEKD